MSYDSCVRIERLANGYTVTLKDPAIVAANNKSNRSSNSPYTYRDPERCYTFDSVAKVTKFITDNLDKALPAQADEDSFDKTFDKAAAAASKVKD